MIVPGHGSSQGLVFDIDTFAVHDGPGIRMAVYLKGCPLRCRWCHSPESQSPRAQVILLGDRCARCGRCAEVCEHGVHAVAADRHAMKHEACVVCGRCVANCPADAIEITGEAIEARYIVEKAVRFKPFFDHSGGGVTLTGGEVSLQPDFARQVLSGCRDQGIHTAIETCGACDWPVLEGLAGLCDLVLYDLKLMDDDVHRQWTGASNRQILANARRLAGKAVQVRLPLIPGITDTHDNLAALFAFMREAGLSRLAMLPYNPSAAAKYEWLGRPYEVDPLPRGRDHLDRLLAMAKASGLDAVIA